ncbi:MAG TPA: hypothetical protein VMZ91_16420 [Candidatus Paceibacterota bacterium]|nr:hypothetical protein [Candidatus Paceibacterota bacterium]
MVLRKGKERLNRVCRKCLEYFEPTGKCQKLCNNCCTKTSSVMYNLVKLQRKVNKQNGN